MALHSPTWTVISRHGPQLYRDGCVRSPDERLLMRLEWAWGVPRKEVGLMHGGVGKARVHQIVAQAMRETAKRAKNRHWD